MAVLCGGGIVLSSSVKGNSQKKRGLDENKQQREEE